jgi:hypothetical protein
VTASETDVFLFELQAGIGTENASLIHLHPSFYLIQDGH